MTLIEVLAGLVIIGTLLASMIVAKSRFVRQWHSSNARMEAIVIADKLLAQWWQTPEKFPRSDEGPVPDNERFHWRTRIVDDFNTEESNIEIVEIVRLEIFGSDNEKETRPLASVEIVLPRENISDYEAIGDNQ